MNRFPSYELSDFQYWELCNIYDMDLVKAVIEKRIGSSKKISVDRFIGMAEQFDSVIREQEKKFGTDPESSVFSSLVLFTLNHYKDRTHFATWISSLILVPYH